MNLIARKLLAWQRAKAARTAHPALKALLEAPLPANNALWLDIDFLCLDFETTGLDNGKDAILSIGAVDIRSGQVDMASAYYQVIRFDGKMDEGALAIHGLTHDEVAGGKALEDALMDLVDRLRGKILVAHASAIETGFLNAVCAQHLGAPAPLMSVCTLALEQKRQARGSGSGASVRLADTRARYGLPRYKAHNALTDALATAELFIAQAQHIAGDDCRMKDLIA